MEVKQLVVGPIEENCYLVYEIGEKQKNCFLVDPGAGGTKIVNTLKSLDLVPEAIFLTHGHFDHIMAVNWVRKEYPGIPVYAWEKEKEVLEDPEKNLLGAVPGCYEVNDVTYLPDEKELKIGSMEIRLLATPGHTAGSCCLYMEKEGILFSGDTLFRESAGRTDFPTGDDRAIRKSILERLFPLPEETVVYPGHGETTLIAHEKKYNFVMLGF